MAIVGMARDEVGERQLAERLGVEVAVELRSATGWTRCGGSTIQPSRTPGPSVFDARADVDDVVRRGALQGADRLPVVAELAVVVVLDDDAADAPRPRGERAGAVRCRVTPGRVMVGRGDHHGPPRRREGVGVRAPIPSTASGDDPLPGEPHHLAVKGKPGILHARPRRRRPARREQVQRPARAGGDHDPLRVGLHPAGAAEVVRPAPCAVRSGPRVAVAERAAGRCAGRPAGRAQPGGGRERGDIGGAGPQVEPRPMRRAWTAGSAERADAGPVGDPVPEPCRAVR